VVIAGSAVAERTFDPELVICRASHALMRLLGALTPAALAGAGRAMMRRDVDLEADTELFFASTAARIGVPS
jgi:hypothetical protein